MIVGWKFTHWTFDYISDVTKFKILTSTSWFSDMDSGSAVNFAIWNVYGQGCGTPWLYGSAGFGTGDTFTATDCNGFIMPNRVTHIFTLGLYPSIFEAKLDSCFTEPIFKK